MSGRLSVLESAPQSIWSMLRWQTSGINVHSSKTSRRRIHTTGVNASAQTIYRVSTLSWLVGPEATQPKSTLIDSTTMFSPHTTTTIRTTTNPSLTKKALHSSQPSGLVLMQRRHTTCIQPRIAYICRLPRRQVHESRPAVPDARHEHPMQ
ncbi:hypothetical protein BO86DRAFT_148624 [Aspergillus japonicus CBS 114.51]|uniref:Uncharacterized protein n=2 Tax=Aspergillus TaxID=5052 RepID=A0A2V5GQD8_ASPV1|nr:hypothetical protein BO86DRAFT_148624 [Aspergillus japonicus CBS 114.51]PYI13315.1 hypothetical protein BO99DRAFT_63345 [Aspergillus violaceofuscus CBS 115571]RAH79688.1 hypothetical protein BO86DRAFT_148624 [Aspergillus japonicus CBS 114.51]